MVMLLWVSFLNFKKDNALRQFFCISHFFAAPNRAGRPY